jgi:hypothetical protein
LGLSAAADEAIKQVLFVALVSPFMRGGRVRKIAPTPVPGAGASQGDFAHPTEL